MRTYPKLFTRICAGFMVTLCIPAMGAQAHDTWIVMQNYQMVKSQPAAFQLLNAHTFIIPSNELLASDEVASAQFTSPDGKITKAEPAGEKAFKSAAALKTNGTYVLSVQKKAGFSSNTTDGYKKGITKKDADNVVLCKYSEKFCKAVFSVGKPGGKTYKKALGHTMEILPLKDPAGLKKGDMLPIQVLFQGKPAALQVFCSYAGFSDAPGTFAYTTKTDKQGLAKIKMLEKGVWLLLAKQESAYPDATVCDQQSFAATLTFQIQ